jgi:4,5-DOPA dioxygenase extradiol
MMCGEEKLQTMIIRSEQGSYEVSGVSREFGVKSMGLTRRSFIKSLAIGGLAFGLPFKPLSVMGDSEMSKSMPVLFVGHGSPMNAIEKSRFADTWKRVGESLPKPTAILCISAHWETDDARVTTSEHPETIYDFWGFPKELYEVTYPAAGSPEMARSVIGMFPKGQMTPDPSRGFDHGCWIVLVRMFPEADIPVIQLGLNQSLSPQAQYDLSSKLSPLRQKGVLILGSGNIVHNLGVRRANGAAPYDWAVEFYSQAKKFIEKGDHKSLIEYERLGRAARLSIPTNEHYLPLLYALALQKPGESIHLFNEEIVSGSISMMGLQIG